MFSQQEISRFSQLKTPFYYYNLEKLKSVLEKIRTASAKYSFVVHYAMKANANEKLLGIIHDYGFGADCVSGNEVKKATTGTVVLPAKARQRGVHAIQFVAGQPDLTGAGVVDGLFLVPDSHQGVSHAGLCEGPGDHQLSKVDPPRIGDRLKRLE